MRGGAIPFIVWALLNLILLIIAAIWDGGGLHNRGIHVGLTGYTVLVIFLGGLVLLALHRRSIHKGPPEYVPKADPLPRLSFAGAGFGLGCGVAAFGIPFGKFLIYIGGAVILLSLGVLARELAWQHRTMRTVRRERRL
jgi:hypothetical protein